MKNEKSGHATIINAEEGPHLTVVGIKQLYFGAKINGCRREPGDT